MSRTKSGICHLCGKESTLTFEHVPPRKAFNKTTKYREINMLDYFQRKDPLKEKIKGKIEQGGVGYYSLCSSCNSFLGREYVEPYTKYSNSFISCGKSSNNLFVLDMHNFEASRVIKQIVSMFLSINSPEFALSEPELRDFVLSPSNKTLPDKFRFFAYTNFEGSIRNLGVTLRGSLTTGNSILASEFTFPPMGHVMTIGLEGTLNYMQEITSFKDHDFNEFIDFRFTIGKLPTYIPMLLDYRTKEEIESTINSNLKDSPNL